MGLVTVIDPRWVNFKGRGLWEPCAWGKKRIVATLVWDQGQPFKLVLSQVLLHSCYQPQTHVYSLTLRKGIQVQSSLTYYMPEQGLVMAATCEEMLERLKNHSYIFGFQVVERFLKQAFLGEI
jgi:hypothetical protein